MSFYFVGDSAYPLSNYMITPFKDNGRLTRPQRNFNCRVSSVRQTVERAIGHMKGRFRRLKALDCKNLEDVCYLVTSACALHNLCILTDDYLMEDCEPDLDVDPNDYQNIFANARIGVDKRNRIVQYLQQFQ